MALHAPGRKAESDAALAVLMHICAKDGAYNIAHVLTFRDEADRAFEWLDKAATSHDPGLSDVAMDRCSPTSTRTRAG